MNRIFQAAIAAAIFTLAMTGRAQTVLIPGDGTGRLSVAKRIGDEPKPAPPVIPDAKPEKRAKGPTEITAREATMDNRLHLATFSTDVIVHDPEFHVTCDRMTVHLKKPPEAAAGQASGNPPEKPVKDPRPTGAGPDTAPAKDATSGIEKAIVEGNVVIIQDKPDATGKPQRYIGKGKKAVFENATGNITLTGWPQVSQSIGGTMSKEIISREETCVIIINRAGRIDVKGYHTTTLHDSGAIESKPR